MLRSVLMGSLSDYDDNIEHINTHPTLLPKAEAEGVISKHDLDVLKRAIGSILIFKRIRGMSIVSRFCHLLIQ